MGWLISLSKNSELMNTIREMVPVIGSHNNNTTNINKTKNFNIQFFLNETCKDALNISEFVNAESLWLGIKIENRLQNREAAAQRLQGGQGIGEQVYLLAGGKKHLEGRLSQRRVLTYLPQGVAYGFAPQPAQIVRPLRVLLHHRSAHRVPLEMKALLHLPDGRALACSTVDFSTGGMAIRLDHRPQSAGIFASSMRDFESLRDFVQLFLFAQDAVNVGLVPGLS